MRLGDGTESTELALELCELGLGLNCTLPPA